jgi:hypothetical protein
MREYPDAILIPTELEEAVEAEDYDNIMQDNAQGGYLTMIEWLYANGLRKMCLPTFSRAITPRSRGRCQQCATAMKLGVANCNFGTITDAACSLTTNRLARFASLLTITLSIRTNWLCSW